LTTFRGAVSDGGAGRPLDRDRLERVLQDLTACRHLLDQALKGG